MEKAPGITVIGMGLTGSIAAIHLLRGLPDGTSLTLIEAPEDVDRRHAGHGGRISVPVNIRAAHMSALEDDPAHFVRWLWARDVPSPQRRLVPPTGHTFVERSQFNDYVDEVLRLALAEHGSRLSVSRLGAPVTGITRLENGDYRLLTGAGDTLVARHVVLCLGSLPPTLPPQLAGLGATDGRIIADPWSASAYEKVGAEEPVVIYGTGHTMADAVLALDAQGHRGPVVAFSSRGLLPQEHDHVRPYPLFLDGDDGALGPLELLRRVRREVAGTGQRYGWRSVMDALVPVTDALWQSAGEAGRRQFLRHLRPYWDVHAHRLSPNIAGRLAVLQAQGRLRIVPGRLVSVTAEPERLRVVLSRRGIGGHWRLDVGHFIVCSSPRCDYERISDPLMKALLATGLARPDGLQLGLEVTGRSELIGAAGGATPGLYALGPTCRGQLWEVTSLPDIRAQAARLADYLATSPGELPVLEQA